MNRRLPPADPGEARRFVRGAGTTILLLAALAAPQAAAQERPSAIAPYRYASPPAGALDSLEQQKAQSYRTQLEGQRRLQEMNRAQEAGATRLRSQGELNREIGRMDRLLQQQ